MKTILKVFGYIIGFLLMAAGLIAIVMYIMGLGAGEGGVITTMPPVESVTPAPDGNTVLEDTQQNGTSSITVGTPTPFIPTPSPTPDVTPEPTPEPTPTPEPQASGTPLGGGTFSSNTELWIDIDAVWSAEAIDNNTAKVTVTANLRSYRLQIGEKRNSLEIIVGDDGTAMDVPALNIDTQQEVTTELGTYTFTVDAPIGKITLIPLEVKWNYNGVYSGKQLDVISAKGDMTINR